MAGTSVDQPIDDPHERDADDMIRRGRLRMRRAPELALLFLVSGLLALPWAQGTDRPILRIAMEAASGEDRKS